jgi:uncharacterized protein YndB with AHSA1/START domain
VTVREEDETVVVRRVLAIPREEVFEAWLDPDSLARWMCPGGVTRASAEVDPRVGGSFRIVMHDDRQAVEHHGRYLQIEPPSLLSFTWISVNTDHQPSVVTVELLPHERGTALVLTHRGLPPTQVAPHRNGWTDIVRKLGAWHGERD